MAHRARPPVGAVAGALIGTVGLAAEYGWSHVVMPLPWPGSLFPAALFVAVLAGVAGGVIGAIMGSAMQWRPSPLPAGARVALPPPRSSWSACSATGWPPTTPRR